MLFRSSLSGGAEAGRPALAALPSLSGVAEAGRPALAALPSLSGVAKARKLGPHPSLAPCARAWLQGPAAGSPEPAQLPLPCAGGARLSGPLRRRASAVCPLLCMSDIARSHVGSPPHAGLVSPHGCVCFCGRLCVTCFPVNSGACIFPVGSLGPILEFGRPLEAQPSVSCRLCVLAQALAQALRFVNPGFEQKMAWGTERCVCL